MILVHGHQGRQISSLLKQSEITPEQLIDFVSPGYKIQSHSVRAKPAKSRTKYHVHLFCFVHVYSWEEQYIMYNAVLRAV